MDFSTKGGERQFPAVAANEFTASGFIESGMFGNHHRIFCFEFMVR